MTHFSSDADVLDYFKTSQRKAINVTWAHAVNSRVDLEKALAGIMKAIRFSCDYSLYVYSIYLESDFLYATLVGHF